MFVQANEFYSTGSAESQTDCDRLTELLQETARLGGSDLVLVVDAPPTVYVKNEWTAIADETLTAEAVLACLSPMLTEARRATLEQARDIDIGYAVAGLGRYRVNIHYQRGTIAAAIRTIPATIPPFDTLGLPPQILQLADFASGLVLVTGCTGQGKSTTLAAMIDHINRTRACHVVTIEDPIEFSFQHGQCLIEQRQIGEDSPSFASALRHVLRQRPDIILVGEMRDLETVTTALTAAETGHLVLASLHTSSAAQTLARIIDVFPPVQQSQIRTQLAASLRAIVCQVLVRDQLNDMLAPATEILMSTSAIRRVIRDNETHLIYSMIETGKQNGMHTLEQSLAALVAAGRVTTDSAFAVAADPARLEKLIGRAIPAAQRDLIGVEAGDSRRMDIPWGGE